MTPDIVNIQGPTYKSKPTDRLIVVDASKWDVTIELTNLCTVVRKVDGSGNRVIIVGSGIPTSTLARQWENWPLHADFTKLQNT